MAFCPASFTVTVVGGSMDATIEVSSVVVNADAVSPSTFNYFVYFTYDAGTPPATGLEMEWTSVSPAQSLPAIGTITPTTPMPGIHSGVVSGSVSVASNVRTAFSGRVIIRQS